MSIQTSMTFFLPSVKHKKRREGPSLDQSLFIISNDLFFCFFNGEW